MTWLWPQSTITRVIDGDTLQAQLTRDLGFNGTVTFQQRFRLARINAPQIKVPAGVAARDALIALVNGPVTIESGKPYKYGDEWMAEITVGDLNISDEMVHLGHAVPWDGKGPRPGDTP